MNEILIGTGNFHYFNWDLEKILKFVNGLGIDGVELSVPHDWRMSEAEKAELLKMDAVTVHLHGISNDSDIEFIDYCIANVPNFKHFTVHPDITDKRLLKTRPDLAGKISFENMDPRKDSFQTPEEMEALFDEFPESGFTFDVNHCLENGFDPKSFDVLKEPNKYHVSSVNSFPSNFYGEFGEEFQTPHGMCVLDPDIRTAFHRIRFGKAPIVLEGVFVPGTESLITKEIELVKELVSKK